MTAKSSENEAQTAPLERLLQQSQLWKASSVDGRHVNGRHASGRHASGRHASGQTKDEDVIETGYAALDRQLHCRGWPLSSINELCFSTDGIGELRLLMPALRKLLCTTEQALWIAPPVLPFAPALNREGIDQKRLTIVQTNNIKDTLWAAEQALLANCCTAVFAWSGQHDLSNRALRRLQLATQKNHCWFVLLRHSDCLKQPSASKLRLHLQSNRYSQLDIKINKQPYGWGGQHCTLSLPPYYENWQRLPSHLLPQHNQDFPVQQASSLGLHQRQYKQNASVTVLGAFAAMQSVH